MIWNQAEQLPAREMASLQLERLQRVIRHAYDHVPFYRERLAADGLEPESFRSLKDLERVPFTVKTDLRDHYPFGLFAVPQQQIVR